MKKKIINSGICDEGVVLRLTDPYSSHFVISDDRILLFKKNEQILIGNTYNVEKKSMFYIEKFQYNKPYLDMGFAPFGNNFQSFTITHNGDTATLYEKVLRQNDSGKEPITKEMTRSEVEEFFNSDNYDAMYLVNKSIGVLFARNKNDGMIVGDTIVPSDEEIVKLELNHRNRVTAMHNCMPVQPSEHIIVPFDHIEKPINEIRNVPIYYPLFISDFSDLLITSKNGEFRAQWIMLDYLDQGKFRLTTLGEGLLDKNSTLDTVSSNEKGNKRLFKSIFKK